MGPGVPIPSELGGSVTAWCGILVDSGRFLAKTIKGLGLRMREEHKARLVQWSFLALQGCQTQ